MYSDATKFFETLRHQAEEKANGKTRGTFGNPNILKLKQGYSYKLRLLWIPAPEGIDRNNPMINQYVHTFWDDNAVGQKSVTVYCKTSEYDEGETKIGWECPVCKKAGEFYNEYKKGSISAKQLYDRCRRSYRGYVPVYVVEGPEEDLHKVKILQYTKSFKDFFSENIFGIVPKKYSANNEEDSQKIDESEILGINAFTYYEPKDNTVHTEAYNFIVTVGTKNVPNQRTGQMIKMPDYKIKFSKNTSEIDFDGEPITVERYLGLSEELGFDTDFALKSTTEELKNFVSKYVDSDGEVEGAETEDIEEEISKEVEKPVSKLDKFKDLNKVKTVKPPFPEEEYAKDEDEVKVKKAETKKPTPEEEKEPEDIEETASESSDEDIDIDDLLKDI